MTPPRSAAVLWLVAGVLWFVLEGIAAAAFPAYSYATNYISDLGVTVPGTVDGRVIDSPLALVMNVDFVVHGVLFLIAAVLVARATSGWMRWLFTALAACHALGLVLVATFHSSAEAQLDGTIGIHVLGANLAIIGGNLALIVAGLAVVRLGRAHRVFSIAWGAIGLACILMLFIDTHSTWTVLPDGVWERLAVYPMMTWEIVTAFVVLVSIGLRRRSRR
jgi:hypothetical membrane protein